MLFREGSKGKQRKQTIELFNGKANKKTEI